MTTTDNLFYPIKDLFHKFCRWFAPRVVYNQRLQTSIVNEFHTLFYEKANPNIKWKGIPIRKCPNDLINYSEVIQTCQPDLIIELGTDKGGSAIYFAEARNDVYIITVDIREQRKRPHHSRIKYITGDSLSNEVVERIFRLASRFNNIMLVLDSDHSKQHVLDELNTYSSLVTKGQYLVIEDTNVNGNPVYPSHGPGPLEAGREFLLNSGNIEKFDIDVERKNRYLFSYNTWLKRL